MTIDDKIRDEKLQYDINREAGKLSALSPWKNDKYENFTSEEILPSNQRQVLERAKFTYSPLGKAFEKQTKTIEEQVKKKIKTLEEHGKQIIKSSGEKNSLKLLKQKKIFDELINEMRLEINKVCKGIDFNNLTYYYTSKSALKYFVRFKGPLIIYNDVKNGWISLQKAEKIWEELWSELNKVLKGNPNYKSTDQIRTIENIQRL